MRVFCTLEGERHPKHPVHRGVHLRVHLGDSSNCREEKQLNPRRGKSWARAKHRSGGGRPPPFYPLGAPKVFGVVSAPTRSFSACAPKKVFGVVPAHTLSPKVLIMHSIAISIPEIANRTKTRIASPCADRPGSENLDRQRDRASYGARILGAVKIVWLRGSNSRGTVLRQ